MQNLQNANPTFCRCKIFGGQGEVYKAQLAGEYVAVKWFFPAMATAERRASMELLIRKGAPSEHFLYPMEITTAAGVPGFGYIMPLRRECFKNIVDFRRAESSRLFAHWRRRVLI